MIQRLAVRVLLAVLAPWAFVASSTAQEPLLLTGARVLDVGEGRYLEGQAVLIRDGRIVRMGPVDILEAEGAQRVDLTGKTLLPGLIDLHSHLLLHPYDETSWDDQVLREPLELRTIRGTVAARKTLEAGFTTLRELGTEGAAFADVALRDAIDQGFIPGPRIYAATRALVATASYGPSGFDPRWELPKGAQVADGPTGVRKAVRQQVAAGADWIKVYADYRRVRGGPSTATYSQEELDALVDEATTAGRPVAAHAATDEAIRRAVRAGVKTIEHGYGASPEALRLMADNGVVLCPTLAATEAIAIYQGWTPGEPEPARIRDAKAMFRRALDAGVTLALGSDVGVFDHGDNARELELMVEYGMTPAQALAAATVVAAEVLGRDDLGVIAPRAAADLIVVDGDPLADVSAVRTPRMVLQEGRIVVDRR